MFNTNQSSLNTAIIVGIILMFLQGALTPTYAFFTSALGIFITIVGFLSAGRLKKVFFQIVFVIEFLIFLNYLLSFVL